MKKALLGLVLLCCASNAAWAQSTPTPLADRCGSTLDLEKLKKFKPKYYENWLKIEQQTQNFIKANKTLTTGQPSPQRVSNPYVTVTIPVIVHVIYHTAAQNISDAQIQSQIDVLNEDFRHRGINTNQTPDKFKSVAADVNIEFKLACTDPNGNPTNGIVRTFTGTTLYSVRYDGAKNIDEVATGIKFTSGAAAWPAEQYFNIWTCNLGGGTLGYAQFPGMGSPNTDGIVVGYDLLGRTGTLRPPFDQGRTATHEAGHWLNVYHIWGDQNCGDDFCGDTPTQKEQNTGCPSFPHKSCSNDGDMFMNYMDYTDDACMNLFTNEQKGRMRALFDFGGARESFISATIQQVSTTTCGTTTASVSVNQGALVSYNWGVTGSLQLSAGQGTPQATFSQTATGLATITLSANGYCSNSWTTYVGVPPTPAFTYSETLNPCYGQDASGNFATSNAQPGVDYVWNIVDISTGDVVLNGGGPIFYFNSAALYPGSFQVTMQASTACGTTSRTLPLTIRDCGGGGMYRTANVYPNPATDVVMVELPAGTRPPAWAGVLDVVLYDRFGQQLRASRSQRDKAELDVRTVPNGLYYLRIGTGNDAAYKQVQIVH
jgi:hypothetical protein